MSTNPFLVEGSSGSQSPPAQSNYAAPPGPPPPPRRNGEGSSGSPGATSQGYHPTTVPTPGQPLLRDGKTLVYPNGWKGCPKCQDTGFKHGDPSHPCKKCWSSYSQPYNPILASSVGLAGAKVMQKPLPQWSRPGTGNILAPSGGYAPGGGPMPMGRPGGGMAGYPGAGPSFRPPLSPMQPQQTGYSDYMAPQSPPMGPPANWSMYAAPNHAPPAPRLPRRPSPPAVARAEDAREDANDDSGEAPPAYADVIKSGPGGVLPPQPQGGAAEHAASSLTSQQSPPRPDPHSPQHHQHPYQYPPHHPSSPQQQHPFQYPQHPPGGYPGAGGGGGFPRPPFAMPHHAGMPPPGAMVVHPGDPRIGGRLCYKCGGAGVRDALFLFQETCYHCNGLGRIL
ncbi:hypothetical protein FA10DRAFT_264681 [Acaromyces ingoldii]|uniref:Uncharacterized protein n=1 Tax=Acaromyces ingoldii TaxID=215250 RepID=A0A316YYF7_9BASI|nr:hypothetical protein FA10DRAFT_264681 [Acaromyces ingoldii]PWN94096.1 hypothetical protein FA10DRAFT_264681 [Acaromyces ingoldii]